MEHVSTYTAPMFIRCPACGAAPFNPCHAIGNPYVSLRYTHAERNRA